MKASASVAQSIVLLALAAVALPALADGDAGEAISSPGLEQKDEGRSSRTTDDAGQNRSGTPVPSGVEEREGMGTGTDSGTRGAGAGADGGAPDRRQRTDSVPSRDQEEGSSYDTPGTNPGAWDD